MSKILFDSSPVADIPFVISWHVYLASLKNNRVEILAQIARNSLAETKCWEKGVQFSREPWKTVWMEKEVSYLVANYWNGHLGTRRHPQDVVKRRFWSQFSVFPGFSPRKNVASPFSWMANEGTQSLVMKIIRFLVEQQVQTDTSTIGPEVKRKTKQKWAFRQRNKIDWKDWKFLEDIHCL